MELGKLIVEVGVLVAKQCDIYVHKTRPDSNSLEQVVKTSKTAKARLLHYFSLKENQLLNVRPELEYSNWCGWHNDHGSLTGLCSAMYLNEKGEEVKCPDTSAGLYCKARNGDLVKVSIPSDHLAFQIGETAQIHSGGILQATAHCVKGAQGPSAAGISRETFAVFMEPEFNAAMSIPNGSTSDDVLRGSGVKNLPPGVPPLGTRWEPSQDFGAFTEKTLKSYYR